MFLTLFEKDAKNQRRSMGLKKEECEATVRLDVLTNTTSHSFGDRKIVVSLRDRDDLVRLRKAIYSHSPDGKR
jgi:hypothetical protein